MQKSISQKRCVKVSPNRHDEQSKKGEHTDMLQCKECVDVDIWG